MADPWRLCVLGQVARLERGDTEWIPERRTAALLALLALDGPMPRVRAAGLLFPDRDPARARGNLRQLLFRLRERGNILTDEPLALQRAVLVDADAPIDARWAPREPLSVLGGYDYDDLGEVGERLAAARVRVRNRLRTSYLGRARQLDEAGDTAGALDVARDLATLDPLDEEAVRFVMRLQLGRADPTGALAVYARLREALEQTLGVRPSRDTSDLAKRAATEASSPLDTTRPIAADRPVAPVPVGAPMARRAEAGGWIAEGAELLRAAASDLEPGPERGRLLVHLAWLEHQLGRQEAARAAAEAGLLLLPAEDRTGARSEGLFVLGSIAHVRGDPQLAGEHWRRALELAAQREGGRNSLALELNLAMVEDGLGRADAALGHYLAALPLAEAAGDTYSTIVILNNVGHVLSAQGRTAEARPLLLRSTALAERFGDRRLHAYALETLALCELGRNEPGVARGMAARVLLEARAIGDPVLQVESAVTFADAEAALGDSASAMRTVRAALAIARTHGYVAGYLPGVMRGVLLLARLLGPSDATARRAVGALASDPEVAPDVRETARQLATAWDVAVPEAGERATASVAELLAERS